MSRIDIIRVILRVVNMFLRPITPQPLTRDLKLRRRIPKRHKPQHPQQQPDRLRAHVFHGPHVDGLAVVAQPVAEVDALDVELAELLAAHGARGEEGEEDIFDVAVAPVLAFDFGDAGDVAGLETEERSANVCLVKVEALLAIRVVDHLRRMLLWAGLRAPLQG